MSAPETPARAYARTATEFRELSERAWDAVIDCSRATWDDVGSLGHARDLLVQAAFALGAITEDEARERYGVTL